jgi:hypothetical protein
LAFRFHVSSGTIIRIFQTWINLMCLRLGSLCIWPTRQEVWDTTPSSFKRKYPSVVSIIDATEFHFLTPSSLAMKSEMFSQYTSHVTAKGLLGISPSGRVTFVSSLYAGAISVVNWSLNLDSSSRNFIREIQLWQTAGLP